MNTIYNNYKKEIQHFLNVDDLAIKVLEDECNRKPIHGLLAKNTCLFYIFLSILSKFLFFFSGVKRNVNIGDEDFVFVSCPDSIFRTKTIDLIAHGLNYQIIYLPSFHLLSALKYARYFKKTGVNVTFPTFTISDVLKARKTLSEVKKVIRFSENQDGYKPFLLQITTFLIYANLIKRNSATISSFKGKWIMEHQKFFFIPLISYLRNEKKETVMLQHGCFFKPSYNYLPLYTDKVLTCCEREKKIYVENGVNPGNVIVFGAPLQTLTCNKQYETKEYDLLLLMTIFNVNGNLQIEILNYLKASYPDLKILIRMRPRSRENDLKNLGKSIEGFAVSEPNVSIGEDLAKADKVICFSEDATFEVLNAHKSFLLIGTEETMDKEMYKICTTPDNYKEQISILLGTPHYSPFTKEEEIYMMGEQDVNILHSKFTDFIYS